MIELAAEITARLRENITSLVTVDSPANFMYALEQHQDITPLLPAAWVTVGGAVPQRKDQNTGNYDGLAVYPFTEEQDYEVWLMLPHNLDDQNHTLTDQNASLLLLGIIKLLHGWKPAHASFYRKMVYKGRDATHYDGSYAAYPLTFSTLRSITDVETA
jgi:hypothetical protein